MHELSGHIADMSRPRCHAERSLFAPAFPLRAEAPREGVDPHTRRGTESNGLWGRREGGCGVLWQIPIHTD
jgi:hypothetical protein